MVDRRAVTMAEAENLKAQLNLAGYFECSAKTKKNVPEMFAAVAQALVDAL